MQVFLRHKNYFKGSRRIKRLRNVALNNMKDTFFFFITPRKRKKTNSK